MDRRSIAVCTTVTLSILALVDATAARTSNRLTPEKRTAVTTSRASASRRPRDSKVLAARSGSSCAPCAAAVARNKKSSLRKASRTAKDLPCHPKNYIDPKVAPSYNAALRDMKRAGIKPQITSAWRSSENQAQLHRCTLSTRCRRANPGLYRALPAGKSMHEAGFAVDMAGIAAGPRGEKRLTPKGRRIVSIMRRNGFNWRYGLADPAHFEADPRRHGYRTVQQAITRTQTTCQLRLARNKAHQKLPNKVAAIRSRARARARMPVETAATKTRRHSVRVRA